LLSTQLQQSLIIGHVIKTFRSCCRYHRDTPLVAAYRVFIASPGGLEDERRHFRETINDFNEADALRSGALFIPIGWELTLAGIGRPQELVNDDLKLCDYCIFVLHDRWGSPASRTGPYSSGTEEEYALARWLVAEKKMINLVVCFKKVDASRLSDPGPQLQKVLDFRRKLEEDKELLFHTYSDLADFGRLVRRHLTAWQRTRETSETAPPPGVAQ
jgi:hypothetical protein